MRATYSELLQQYRYVWLKVCNACYTWRQLALLSFTCGLGFACKELTLTVCEDGHHV